MTKTLLLLLALPAFAAGEGVTLLPASVVSAPVEIPGYNRETGRSGHVGAVGALAFDPSGGRFVSVSYKGSLVDVAKGTAVKDYLCLSKRCRLEPSTPYDSPVDPSAAFTHDGSRVLLSERDVLRIWRTDDASLLAEHRLPGDIASLSLAPDGKTLTLGDAGGFVFQLDLDTGKRKELLKGKRERYRSAPARAVYTPIIDKVFAGSEKGLLQLDPVGVSEPRTLVAESVSELALSPDGRLLAAVVGKGVRVWMPFGWVQLYDLPYEFDQPRNLSFSDDKLAFSLSGPNGNRLVVVDALKGERLLDVPFKPDVHSLALSRDGEVLAVGGMETIFYWRSLSLKRAYSAMDFAMTYPEEGARLAEKLAKELESKLAEKPLPAKGEFESTAEHEARVKAVQDEQALVREDYEAKIAAAHRKDREAREAAKARVDEGLEAFGRRFHQLSSADHRITVQGKLGAYDADAEAFQVEALGARVKARVPREKAKGLDRAAPYLLEAVLRYHDKENVRLVSARLLDPNTREPLSPDEDLPAPKPAAQAAPPKLELASVAFEDASGDGVLEAGETGKVKVRLRNAGKGEAYGVKLKLEGPAQGLAFKESSYVGTVPPGEEKAAEASVAAEAAVPEGEASLKAVLSESQGFDSKPVVLKFKLRPLRLPKLELAGIEIKDAEGNRTLAKGREGEVTLVIRNVGQGPARKVRIRLSSKDEQVKIFGESEADLGALAPGETKRAAFSVAVTRRYAGPSALPLSLSLSEERPECAASPELGVLLGVEPSDIKVVQVPSRETALKTEASIDAVPAVKAPAFGPEDFGVVVGIERYRDLPRSEFSSRDAKLFKEYLKALGVPERNIELLVDEKATKSSLERALGTWLKNRVKPGGRVVVYYSGHGAPEPATGEAFLVPYDGEAEYLKDSAVPLEKLKERLGKLPAAEVLLVLDSCFSGAGGRSVLAKGARPLVMTRAEGALPSNMAVLAASQGSQISTSSPEKRHGLLTWHLLKALQEGSPDLVSAFEKLKPRVEDEAKASSNASQTPALQPPPEKLSGRFLLRR